MKKLFLVLTLLVLFPTKLIYAEDFNEKNIIHEDIFSSSYSNEIVSVTEDIWTDRFINELHKYDIKIENILNLHGLTNGKDYVILYFDDSKNTDFRIYTIDMDNPYKEEQDFSIVWTSDWYNEEDYRTSFQMLVNILDPSITDEQIKDFLNDEIINPRFYRVSLGENLKVYISKGLQGRQRGFTVSREVNIKELSDN